MRRVKVHLNRFYKIRPLRCIWSITFLQHFFLFRMNPFIDTAVDIAQQNSNHINDECQYKTFYEISGLVFQKTSSNFSDAPVRLPKIGFQPVTNSIFQVAPKVISILWEMHGTKRYCCVFRLKYRCIHVPKMAPLIHDYQFIDCNGPLYCIL